MRKKFTEYQVQIYDIYGAFVIYVVLKVYKRLYTDIYYSFTWMLIDTGSSY